MTAIKTAFYWDNSGLGRAWSLTDIGAAFSGTDSMLLEVAGDHAVHADHPVLWVTSSPADHHSKIRKVESIFEAVDDAARCGVNRLVIHFSPSEDQLRLLKNFDLPCDLIIWAQCTPSAAYLNAAYKNPRVITILAVSHRQAWEWAHHPIFRKTVVIPNFTHVNNWNMVYSGNQKRLVYVGALKESKGFHHIAEIWAEFHASFPDWSLAVCGSAGLYGRVNTIGPFGLAEKEYEARILTPLGGSLDSAAALGVFFLGSLSKEQLFTQFSLASVAIVNPNHGPRSSYETFCVAAVETQAAGLPTLGGAAGGLIETVASPLLLFNNHEMFLMRLGQLCGSPSLRESMSTLCRQYVGEYFTPENVLPRWRKFLLGEEIEPFLKWGKKSRPADYWLRRGFECLFPVIIIDATRRVRRGILNLIGR